MRLPVPTFKVLLYGPGLPKAGLKARAHFEESVLVIQGKGHWFTIQGDQLGLKIGGFDGRQWLLAWDSPSGQVTAMLQGDDALEHFIDLAPPVVSNELKRVHLAYGYRGRALSTGRMLIFLALILTAALTLYRTFA
jgi:hypothetical protein